MKNKITARREFKRYMSAVMNNTRKDNKTEAAKKLAQHFEHSGYAVNS
jgi:hypothetical protein